MPEWLNSGKKPLPYLGAVHPLSVSLYGGERERTHSVLSPHMRASILL